MSNKNNYEKILALVDPTDWHGYSTETFWASKSVQDPRIYTLQNSPFFAKGMSYLDNVLTDLIMDVVTIKSVIKHNGHSTYRIAVDLESRNFLNQAKFFEKYGCSYESAKVANKIIYSMDVPPNADIDSIYSLLESGENNSLWIYEKAHLYKKTSVN